MGNSYSFSRKRARSTSHCLSSLRDKQPAYAAPVAHRPNAANADQVRVDVLPGRSSVLCGVKQPLDALVRVTTPAPPDDCKMPVLHCVAVLDKSGSMGGTKL